MAFIVHDSLGIERLDTTAVVCKISEALFKYNTDCHCKRFVFILLIFSSSWTWFSATIRPLIESVLFFINQFHKPCPCVDNWYVSKVREFHA